MDFGATTKDPADDYPDFAKPAAEAVAAGKAELGLLVCTSGVGVSITANKVSGVRAALISDADTAALCRQHNDVNVLCLSGKNTPPELGQKILEAFIGAKFEGGRHERRVLKMDAKFAAANLRLAMLIPKSPPPLTTNATPAGKHRADRQGKLRRPAVMEAQGSVLTNKYAEGYPKKRWYGGCENMTWSSSSRLTAPRNCSARNTNVQPLSAPARTWRSISRS